MTISQTKIESPSGAVIHAFVSVPKRVPKAVIQINHGMAEHAARYHRFAEVLAKAGYAAIIHDHRGHGKTTARDASLGSFGKGGIEAVLADVDAINAHARDRFPECPVICFGHSMGAIIALNYAIRHPQSVGALAAWNSGVETGALSGIYRLILKVERFFKGSDVPSGIANKLRY